MILNEVLNDALNEQIAHEMRNVQIYHQIQSYFENLQLKNIAKFFERQAEQEHRHAKQLINYINSRVGGKVTLREIDTPMEFTSISQVGEQFLKVEQETTESIESIYALAMEQRSYIDITFINEFLYQQIEEEDEALNFKIRANMVKDLVIFDATFED